MEYRHYAWPTVVLLVVATTAPASAQDYYNDIRPLMDENCVGCHADTGVAFSMEDPEETYERRREIQRMVTGRRMPPWLAEAGHQEYRDDLSLDPEQVALVGRWADAGFPKGRRPSRAMSQPSTATFSADVTLEVLPDDSYLPNQERADDYRCFVVDWPGGRPAFITGFRTVPGNTRVAHHTVVYAADASLRERFHELEQGEVEAGYECFGGALPDRLMRQGARAAYEETYPDGLRELNRGNSWLAHWAPGMFGQAFPEGTGIPIEPGGALVVQMHYYSVEAPGERDRGTRLEFMTDDSVDRPAFHLAQTYNDWLDGKANSSMVIPPGEQATFEVSETLGDLLPQISRVTGVAVDDIAALEVHSANLHMHAYGHSGAITMHHEGGEDEVLLRIPRWDLAWQRDFVFEEPKVIGRDALDSVRIRVQCTFENPNEEPVFGGLGSDDEMCFNFSYIAVQPGPAVVTGREDGP